MATLLFVPAELPPTDGRRRRWDQHKVERRRAVLAAALAVIEDGAPGDEVHVQQIADRAGLSRTVLYRHFADRADLDRAIQTEIVDRVWAEISPVLSLDGTPVAVVRRIVAAYVGWAAAHPALHRFAEADVPGDGPGPLSRMVERAAAQIEGLITLGAELLEVPLDDDLRSALDPLVFGLVGAGMASVRRWTAQEDPVAPEILVDLLTQAVWLQIAGTAAARGVVIDPERPVQELFATEAG